MRCCFHGLWIVAFKLCNVYRLMNVEWRQPWPVDDLDVRWCAELQLLPVYFILFQVWLLPSSSDSRPVSCFFLHRSTSAKFGHPGNYVCKAKACKSGEPPGLYGYDCDRRLPVILYRLKGTSWVLHLIVNAHSCFGSIPILQVANVTG